MNEVTNTQLSVVSTIYNDELNVSLLVSELKGVLNAMAISYEIILVDDGSNDNSSQSIRKVSQTNMEVKGVCLARNYGQQIAVSAGISYAKGEYVLLIDGDLENPVSEIPNLYAKIKKGYDIVFATSTVRQSLVKKWTSDLFWFVMCNMLQIRIIRHQLMMRIMSKKMVETFKLYEELSRSIAGINYDIGLNMAELKVIPKTRIHGSSGHSFAKRLNIFIDIVFSMSRRPLDILIYIGLICIFISVLVSIYYLYIYLTIGSIPGYTSIILSILFFGSVSLFTLGLIARYLALIFLEVRRRPLFVVKEEFNING